MSCIDTSFRWFHTPNDVAHFGHYLNHCCEAPEKGHKTWVGQQGLKTNQGPETQLSMMLHSLRKECSALLCESIQGEFPLIGLDCLYHLLFLITQPGSMMVILAMSMIFGWKEQNHQNHKWNYVLIVGITWIWINGEIIQSNQVPASAQSST